MTTCRHSALFLAVLHVLIAALAVAAPSGSSPSTLELEPLEISDIALLDELSEWIDNQEQTGELRTVIKNRSTSFEVFRNYHEAEVRDDILDHLRFGDLIRSVATRHDLDPLLMAAVVETESSFNPRAISHRGATGLMQVLPSTAALEQEALLDPETNLEQGALYLRRLLRRYDGDLELALAAYNAGPGNVRRYGGVPPFKETQRYVDKVLGRYVAHHQQVWQDNDSADTLIANG